MTHRAVRGRRTVISEAFAQRLRSFLDTNRMTNTEFAELCELSPSTIGRCTNPGYSVLSGVTDRINDTILSLEGPGEPPEAPPQPICEPRNMATPLPTSTLTMLLTAYMKPVIAAEEDLEQAQLMRDVLEEVKRRLTTNPQEARNDHGSDTD